MIANGANQKINVMTLDIRHVVIQRHLQIVL